MCKYNILDLNSVVVNQATSSHGTSLHCLFYCSACCL